MVGALTLLILGCPKNSTMISKLMYRFCLLSLVFLVVMVDAYAQQINIKFKIGGFEDTTAYIGYHFGNQKYLLDTLSVQDGAFEYQGEQPSVGVYFIYAPGYFLEFVMDQGSFQIETTKPGGYAEMIVTNSRENVIFKEFQLQMTKIQGQQRQKVDSLKLVSGQDSLNLITEIQGLNALQAQYRKELIDDNPDSFVSAFLKLLNEKKVPDLNDIPEEYRDLARYNYHHSHYFEQGLLSDPRLLRTPIIHSKVMKYLDEVIIQHPDTIITHVDKILTQVENDNELFRYWLVTLFKKYAEAKIMGMDAVMIHLIEHYYLSGKADWITEEYKKDLMEEVAYVKPNLIGKIAPPINVVDSLSQPVLLSNINAEHTLLMFYDPDCGHCKKAIKRLEELDDRYANAGVRIFAVCTTTDVKRWKKFVRDSNPSWLHGIDPTGKEYFRVYYNVRSTPQIYLLDQDKKILAKKLGVEQFIDIVENRVN